MRLALLVLLLGCGKDKKPAGDGFAGACDRREREHLCSEFWGAGADAKFVQAQCDGMKVPVLGEKCPRIGAVGQCIGGRGTAAETHTLFYPPLSKLSVTELCRGPGQKPDLF